MVQFVAVVNGDNHSFPSKSLLDDFIKRYSEINSIYTLSVFRVEFFNLLENA